MKRLLPMLKPYLVECILSPLLKLLEAILELFVPLIMAAIIDVGIHNRDSAYVLKMSLWLVFLGIFGFAIAATAQYLAAKAAVGFGTKLRSHTFAHIQKFSYTQMDQVGTTTLVNRITSDINQAQSGVNIGLRLFLRSPFVVMGATVMAFTVDVQTAFIFVGLVALLTVIVVLIMRATLPRHKQIQNQLDRVLKVTRENLTGMRVLRAFCKQKSETAEFIDQNNTLSGMQLLVGRISAWMNPLTFVAVNGALIVILWSGAHQVNTGALSQGAVVALVSYLSQILVELLKLANMLLLVTKGMASASRVDALLAITPAMKEESAMDDAVQTEEIAICFDHVSTCYEGASAESLTDISFTAKKGEMIGIIGGTASGKSTLLNLIPRFYEATKGTVKVFGTDVKQRKADSLRVGIGIVPQKAVLFHDTIRGNLQWGNQDATDEQLWQALAIAQGTEVVKSKEKGLDEMVAQHGRNFSGGQRQRLTIARALIKKPSILIMDDSASALDYATDAALRKAIHNMKDRPTVLIASQRASAVRFCDQILVLEDGHLKGMGTHETLMQTCELYQETYHLQFPKEAQA